MNNLELDLLNKKVTVMQTEITEVLGEMQTTIQAMSKMITIALRTLEARISALEPKELDTADIPREGVDL